jgi:uncharacterized protein YaeQ
MALKATICKAQVQVADMDRSYYGDHSLTLARHPSETDERMMVRLLAFALHAQPDLAFGRGLSSEDEPDVWRKDLTGAVELWIEVGLPDERRLRRACVRAREVVVYTYGGRAADLWWNQAGEALARNANLEVRDIPLEGSRSLATLAARNMALQFTIQDSQVWVADGQASVQFDVAVRMQHTESRL